MARAVEALARFLSAPGASELERAVVALEVAAAAERLVRVEVSAARANGATWQEVGDAFGVNRQAAHERFSQGPDGPRLRPSRTAAVRQSRRASGSG